MSTGDWGRQSNRASDSPDSVPLYFSAMPIRIMPFCMSTCWRLTLVISLRGFSSWLKSIDKTLGAPLAAAAIDKTLGAPLAAAASEVGLAVDMRSNLVCFNTEYELGLWRN